MSKLNFERPLFKLLKNRTINESEYISDGAPSSFGFEVVFDSSSESWSRHEIFLPYLFPPIQHAVIVGDYTILISHAKKLPDYINPKKFLLICNELLETRRFIKNGEDIKHVKLEKKLRWNLAALEGLLLTVQELSKEKKLEIEIDERFVSKLRYFKDNASKS